MHLEIESAISSEENWFCQCHSHAFYFLIEKYAKIFKIDVSEVLNISHEKDIDILYEEIQSMIKYANKEQIILIYKLIKNILY